MEFDFSKALDEALNGNAIAFLGAGFSLRAKNILGEDFASANKLAEILATEIGVPTATPLDQVADVYLSRKSSKALLEFLRNQFTCSSTTASQNTIASVPWRRVYTTNYDNVYELSARNAGINVSPVTLSSKPGQLSAETPTCVHINGYIPVTTEDMLQAELKLTSTSYLTQAFSDSHWSQYFRYDIQLANSIFFIGYSLYDLDIKRILFASEQLSKKCYLITSPNTDEVQKTLLSQFGEVSPIGADAFSAMILARRARFHPATTDRPAIASFRQIVVPAAPSPGPSDIDALNLFTFGQISTEAIVASQDTASPVTCHLHRRIAETLTAKINSGLRAALVHAEFGNGKTLIVEDIGVAAARHGWQVFAIGDRKPTAKKELEWICKQSARTLLCVENYQDHFDLLELAQLARSDKVSILMSARSSVHDIHGSRLEDIFSDLEEFDANKLYPEDVVAISRILSHYGLWGGLSAESDERKVSEITVRCRRELHAVLLLAFESPVIRSLLSELVASISKNTSLRDLAIIAMILEFIGSRRSIEFVMQVLGTDAPNQSHLRGNPAIRQLVSMQSGQLLIRNPILAESLLQSIFSPADVMSVLKRVVKVCDERYRDDYDGWNPYRKVYDSLMQFGRLQGILPEKNRLQLIREFYDYTKTLDSAARNPQFWLQYAVAMLTLREYVASKQYFKTAYSFAEKRTGYDTSFIDNHYARFLLETTIAKGTADQAMMYFNDAADIILSQARRPENRYYPYRVASKIGDFFDKFADDLSASDRKRVIEVAAEVLATMPKLESRIRTHRDVVQCERRLLEVSGRDVKK